MRLSFFLLILTFTSWSLSTSAEIGPTFYNHEKRTVAVASNQTYASISFSYYNDRTSERVEFTIDPYINTSHTFPDGSRWVLRPPVSVDVSLVLAGHGIVVSQTRGEWYDTFFNVGAGASMCAAFQDGNRNFLQPTVHDPDRNFSCYNIGPNELGQDYAENSFDFEIYSLNHLSHRSTCAKRNYKFDFKSKRTVIYKWLWLG